MFLSYSLLYYFLHSLYSETLLSVASESVVTSVNVAKVAGRNPYIHIKFNSTKCRNLTNCRKTPGTFIRHLLGFHCITFVPPCQRTRNALVRFDRPNIIQRKKKRNKVTRAGTRTYQKNTSYLRSIAFIN